MPIIGTMINMKTTSELSQLGPLEQLRTEKLARRVVQLVIGLSFFGVSMAMMIRGNLGLAPWDVLHVGLSRYFSMGFGWVVIGVSFVVLLLWIPLREIPGVETIANAVIIGAVADFALRVLGTPERSEEHTSELQSLMRN